MLKPVYLTESIKPARWSIMYTYELTNNQRKYFGLFLVSGNLDKVQISNTIFMYYEGNKIVKVLDYTSGYREYDVDITTKQRQILLPKTIRGKEQKLTLPRILKIKGSGVEFSGSFLGGGIHVYDNRRDLFFIQSYAEEGDIENYGDIEKWVTNYISKAPADYFDWLDKELLKKRLKIKIKEGDIVAFKIAPELFGFARVLVDVFSEIKKSGSIRRDLFGFYERSLIVTPYAFYSDSLQIDIDILINKKTLPTICIFDLEVYHGQMPIVGNKPLSEKDRQLPLPVECMTYITMPYTKTDIETFIATNGVGNIITE